MKARVEGREIVLHLERDEAEALADFFGAFPKGEAVKRELRRVLAEQSAVARYEDANPHWPLGEKR